MDLTDNGKYVDDAPPGGAALRSPSGMSARKAVAIVKISSQTWVAPDFRESNVYPLEQKG